MKDYTIFFTSDAGGRSRTVEISPGSRCHLVEGGLTGFDSTGFDVKITSYASAVGGYPQRRRFAERELSMTFAIDREGEEDTRRMLLSMMDPAASCELDLSLFGVHRRIAVIPCDEAIFSRGTLFDSMEATLCFVAPTVFFRDAQDVAVRYRNAAPLLTFPLNSMAGAGTTAGMYRVTDTAVLHNPGDTACGFVSVIRACGGAIENPGVRCGTSFVSCPITLSDGDELVIDTREKQKTITKNGERIFLFDRGSTFFAAAPGDSELTVTCTTGMEFLDASVSITPLYFGL